MKSIPAHPLTWPQHFPRAVRREGGAFKTSLAGALNNVESSIALFGRDSGKKIENMVISSNYSLGVSNPPDPGVAVWFTWDGLQVCIAVDRYTKIEANLQAIHHIIEARRTELRHGTLALVRATFTGFKALPAPPGSDWWDVLQCKRESSLEVVRAQFKRLASDNHPDKGGSDEKMAAINGAWTQAQEALRG